jgi:hypothetical protein
LSESLQAIASELDSYLPSTLAICINESTATQASIRFGYVTDSHLTITIPTLFGEDWVFTIFINEDNVVLLCRKFIRTFHIPTGSSRLILQPQTARKESQGRHASFTFRKVSLHDPSMMYKIVQIVKQRSETIMGSK